MAIWAIIPAAGVGNRFGDKVPKQYYPILHKTILEHSVEALLAAQELAGIIIVINPSDSHFKKITWNNPLPIVSVIGGDCRAQSVLNAMNFLSNKVDESDFVLVHDAVRPCVTQSELEELIAAGKKSKNGAILACPVSDTIKKGKDAVEKTLDRQDIWYAQTPQLFPFSLLYQALTHKKLDLAKVTDDASAVEQLDIFPKLVTGKSTNIKITTQQDVVMASYLLTNKTVWGQT